MGGTCLLYNWYNILRVCRSRKEDAGERLELPEARPHPPRCPCHRHGTFPGLGWRRTRQNGPKQLPSRGLSCDHGDSRTKPAWDKLRVLLVLEATLLFVFTAIIPGDGHAAARELHHLLRGGSAADPIWLRLPRREWAGTRWLPHQSGDVANGASREPCVVAVPNLQAKLHRGDADRAFRGVLVAGARSGGGE